MKLFLSRNVPAFPLWGGGGALCDQTLCFLYLEFWNYRELATLFTLSENGNPDSLILCERF